MSTPVVLSHRGTPEPSSDIQRRLLAVHPRLSLRFVDGVDHHWAICMGWDERDARWGRVQSGTIDPMRSVDIIGYMPIACSVDEAPSYIERALRQFPRQDVQQVAQHMMQWNDTKPMQAAMEEAIAEVLDAPDPSKAQPKRRRAKGVS